MNNLEHIANNGTDTTKHTDVYNAQFWARRAPSVDAQWSHIALVAQGLALCVIPCHPCMRTCVLSLECFSSPVFLLPHPVPLPALPDVQLGA